MRSNRYLHIAVIVATLLFLVLWQTGQSNAAINISLNKPASTNKDIWVVYPPSNAVDGDIKTYWNAGHHTNPVDPTWLKVDLEGAFAIGQIVLKVRTFQSRWAGYYIDYILYGSAAGRVWKKIGQGRQIDFYDPIDKFKLNGDSMRYLRFDVVGGTHWAHLHEMEVYAPIFKDVPPGYWAEDAIYKIYNAGITTGCSKNPLKYCPERTVNRAQMAVFLERGINSGDYTPPPATGIFDDVPVNFWAADWIEQLYKDGVTTGCTQSPPNYCPDRAVNRAQMAVFLLRSKYDSNYKPPKAKGIFTDVPVTYWAADWIEQLYKEGITSGCFTNPLKYCPLKEVNRAQMAVFIVRTFGF